MELYISCFAFSLRLFYAIKKSIYLLIHLIATKKNFVEKYSFGSTGCTLLTEMRVNNKH